MKRRVRLELQASIGDIHELQKQSAEAARVRLDNLGLVQSHSCFANAPERLCRLKARLELQASISDIHEMQKQSAEAARAMEEDKLRQVLPKAVELFTTGKEASRSFQIKHIKSLLVILFKTTPSKSGPGSRKGEMLKLLSLTQTRKTRPRLLTTRHQLSLQSHQLSLQNHHYHCYDVVKNEVNTRQ